MFEALALLDNQAPSAGPPDPEDTSPNYRMRLRLLLDAMADRAQFKAGTLILGDPSLHGVNLAEVGAWARRNDIRLPPGFPVAIDWSFWRAMRTVKLWQACALVVNLDPDGLKHHAQGWMAGPGSGPVFDSRSFSSSHVKDRLDKALRLAETAVSYMNGPILPKGTPAPGSKQYMDVALSEVVAFFRSCEWPDIPEAIASNAPISVAMPTVTGGQSASGDLPKKVTANGLATQEIAQYFDGVMGWTANRWPKNLSAAKWAESARVARGEPGGASALWNPSTLAQLIHGREKDEREGKKLISMIHGRFNRQSALAPWRDDFNEYFATHCADD